MSKLPKEVSPVAAAVVAAAAKVEENEQEEKKEEEAKKREKKKSGSHFQIRKQRRGSTPGTPDHKKKSSKHEGTGLFKLNKKGVELRLKRSSSSRTAGGRKHFDSNGSSSAAGGLRRKRSHSRGAEMDLLHTEEHHRQPQNKQACDQGSSLLKPRAQTPTLSGTEKRLQKERQKKTGKKHEEKSSATKHREMRNSAPHDELPYEADKHESALKREEEKGNEGAEKEVEKEEEGEREELVFIRQTDQKEEDGLAQRSRSMPVNIDKDSLFRELDSGKHETTTPVYQEGSESKDGSAKQAEGSGTARELVKVSSTDFSLVLSKLEELHPSDSEAESDCESDEEGAISLLKKYFSEKKESGGGNEEGPADRAELIRRFRKDSRFFRQRQALQQQKQAQTLDFERKQRKEWLEKESKEMQKPINTEKRRQQQKQLQAKAAEKISSDNDDGREKKEEESKGGKDEDSEEEGEDYDEPPGAFTLWRKYFASTNWQEFANENDEPREEEEEEEEEQQENNKTEKERSKARSEALKVTEEECDKVRQLFYRKDEQPANKDANTGGERKGEKKKKKKLHKKISSSGKLKVLTRGRKSKGDHSVSASSNDFITVRLRSTKKALSRAAHNSGSDPLQRLRHQRAVNQTEERREGKTLQEVSDEEDETPTIIVNGESGSNTDSSESSESEDTTTASDEDYSSFDDEDGTGSIVKKTPKRKKEPSFQYREPEQWEVNIVSLDRGEWHPGMNPEAFGRWKAKGRVRVDAFFPGSSSQP